MTPKLGPVKVKVWKNFLEDQGLKYLRNNDGHEMWSKKDLNRPITFQPRNKDIPGFHIVTNLRTLGLTVQNFLDWQNGIETKIDESETKENNNLSLKDLSINNPLVQKPQKNKKQKKKKNKKRKKR